MVNKLIKDNINQSNKRMISIDFLKSIAIFGVVFIHARNGNIISEYISDIFRFSVPIFIILFTYFLEKSLSLAKSKKEYYSILIHKFYILFLPYIVFTVFYFFILNDRSTINNTSFFSLLVNYCGGYGFSGQYFFIILFQLILLFPLIQRLSKMKFIYILILSLVMYIITSYLLWDISLINKVSHRFFIYWIPYAILGILLYKNINYFKYPINIFVLIAVLFLIPFEFIILDNYKIIHSPYIIPSVLITSCLLIIYFLVNNNVIQNYLSIKIQKISVYISKRTLGIFLLNPLFIFLLKPYFDYLKNDNIFLDNFLVLAFTFTIFILCILMIKILAKTFIKKLVIN